MSQTRVQLIGDSFDNGANFAGVVTATDFKKSDGSTIESGGGGVGIALSSHPQSALKHVFKTPKILEVPPSAFETIESDEEHGYIAFTLAKDIHVGPNAILTIADETVMRTNTLGIFT